MKPWQKRQFSKENNEDNLRWMISKGFAKTEDEAYLILKYRWKHATREINSNGCWYSFENYRLVRENPSSITAIVNSS